MKQVLIKIATDFTKSPGGRYISEGSYSGEQFRKEILLKKYYEAKEQDCELVVDLDGCYGFPTSFLEESFGGLVREVKSRDIKDFLVIISNDRPSLIEKIMKYIDEASVDE